MNHLDKIELIEQYHNGELIGQSLSDFESQLAADPNFAAEVDDYCSLLIGFDMLHLEAFEAQIQGFEARACAAEAAPLHISAPQSATKAEPATATKPVQLQAAKGGRWLNLRNIAATVAFLVFVPISYFMLMGEGSRFDEHFSPSSALLVDARRDSVQLTPKIKACQDAFTAYNTPKNYDKALPLLQKYAADYGMTPQIELYIGISYLYLNQIPTAISHLQTVAAQTDSNAQDQRQEAEYMLALAYFRQNEPAKTQALLTKIEKQQYHNFKRQADKLAKELTK